MVGFIDKMFRGRSLRKLEQRSKGAVRVHEYVSRKDVNSCAVLIDDTPECHAAVNRLVSQMPHLSVERICCRTMPMEALRGDVIYTDETEVAFGGKIQNEHFCEALEKQYDLLVNIASTSTSLGNYFLRMAHATLRIDFRDNELCDIIIDGVADRSSFVDRLLELLSKLKKY